MILLLFLICLIALLGMQFKQEPFRTKKTSVLDSFMNMSPLSIVDGLHKRIHPYIPYKQHYYKWKRYLRYRE
jgi:hypothetical protein